MERNILNAGRNDPVRLHKFFQGDRTVRGRSGREPFGIHADILGAVFLVQLVSRGARAENARDLRLLDEFAYFVRNDILDARVACADDSAAFQHIPQCDVMLLEHRLFLGNRLGDRLAEDLREHLPETVLRMPVIETHLAGLGRRNRAEQQHAGIPVVNRRELVGNKSTGGLGGHEGATQVL